MNFQKMKFITIKKERVQRNKKTTMNKFSYTEAFQLAKHTVADHPPVGVDGS